LANISRDPKGYYIALGIAEDADAEAIKSAFRSRAKRLHPDFNPSPVAAKQFHRLHEAYATLSDPRKRAAYDRPWKKESAQRSAEQKAKASSAPKPPPNTERPRDADGVQAKPGDILIPAMCRCGQITAQPRFVIFDMVWGRFGRVHRRSLSGVYCRSCADRTALRASMVTWLAGWWAWPDGPRETVRALINNIRGGRRPPDRNARLLMRQARAFQKRGDLELAHNAAEQARQFARTSVLQKDLEELVASLGPNTGRVLKDRWAKSGWAPIAQVLPLAVIIGVFSGVVALTLPNPFERRRHAPQFVQPHAPPPVQTPRPAVPEPGRARQMYTVTVDGAEVRTGPAESFHVIAKLKHGTKVTALEVDPRGDWLRASMPDGTTGFIALTELRPAEPPPSAPQEAH
jgi:curved DNA-binding protein CbpA